MNRFTRSGAAALAAAGFLAACISAAPALAAGADHAVFVQNDRLAGNQIVAYSRSSEGTLTQAGIYNTGGDGGQLTGSVVDHTASQGALSYDHADNLLFAVNAGSNTISVFAVFGDRLALRQVIGSGGQFPVSVTAYRGSVYVLNAEAGGSIQGYAVVAGHLVQIPGSYRALGLATGARGEETQFVRTPGQVAFSPDGSKLIITTKAAGQSIEVFSNSPVTGLSATPVVSPEPGAVPFAVTFDPRGHLLVAEAAGSLASFQIDEDGTLAQLDSVETEQQATCWVLSADQRYYTSNAGSGTLTGFREAAGGQLLIDLGNTPADAGTVDGASVDHLLYVQGGKEGTVHEFRVEPDGSLTSLGSVLVPGAAGGEGIVAA
jgi:6-phosphogluconolactonase (cycloisomerase 2 family)